MGLRRLCLPFSQFFGAFIVIDVLLDHEQHGDQLSDYARLGCGFTHFESTIAL
jgi:hypothetical protein